MQQEVQEFFSRFERANSSLNAEGDTDAVAGLYAESFLFAGQNGAQTVQREGFLKLLPRMRALYASLGLAGREVTSVETQALDARYLLAKVGWRMRIVHAEEERHVEISATYILERGAEKTLSIVCQIDHQDLRAILRNQREV